MRRPRSGPAGGLALKDLQPPIRPLSAMEVTAALVWDRQSICSRLLFRLESMYSSITTIWLEEMDKKVNRPYYWNIHTR